MKITRLQRQHQGIFFGYWSRQELDFLRDSTKNPAIPRQFLAFEVNIWNGKKLQMLRK